MVHHTSPEGQPGPTVGLIETIRTIVMTAPTRKAFQTLCITSTSIPTTSIYLSPSKTSTRSKTAHHHLYSTTGIVDSAMVSTKSTITPPVSFSLTGNVLLTSCVITGQTKNRFKLENSYSRWKRL